MTTVAFTPRNREQARRFFELFYDQCISWGFQKKHYEDDDGDGSLMKHKIGAFIVEYQVFLPMHDDECDEDGMVTDDGCGCCPAYEFNVNIKLYNQTLEDVYLSDYMFGLHRSDLNDPNGNMLPKILEWIDKLPSTFEVCRCAKMVARKDGWCNDCYIYRYTRSEEEGGDCCVCMENEGKWIKLSCNHVIHEQCYNKIRYIGTTSSDPPTPLLCPLCRQPIITTTPHPYD